MVAADRPVAAEGVRRADTFSFDAGEACARIDPSATLAEISREWVLFTHAALLTHGGLFPDPLSAFVVENNLQGKLAMVQSPVALFHGLAIRNPAGEVVDERWNRHLMAIPRDDFKKLYHFFGQIVATDRARGLVISTLAQVIPVVDAPAVLRLSSAAARPPLVSVVAFGLNTNRGQVYFDPPRAASLLTPVRVRVNQRVEEEVSRLSAAILSEETSPSGAAAPVAATPRSVVDPLTLVDGQHDDTAQPAQAVCGGDLGDGRAHEGRD